MDSNHSTSVLGSKIVTVLNFLAAYFAERNLNGGGGKRGRAKIPSPQPPSFLPARAFRIVCAARSAASCQFSEIFAKMGSSIFKQRAPNWTSRFFAERNKSSLAAPFGAARKELLGEIKRRDEIPRNNFFGNETVCHSEVMLKFFEMSWFKKLETNFLRKISRFAGLRRFFIPSPNISPAKIYE